MRLRYDISDKGGLVRNSATEDEDKSSVNKRRRFAQFFERSLDAVKNATKVLAVAVGATVMATAITACMNTSGKYSPDDVDTDVQEEVDEDDGVDVPDIPDVIGDEIEDSDAEDMDVEEEDSPEPTCFEMPAPVDPTVDSFLMNVSSDAITFDGPDSTNIDADAIKSISMTGYPGISSPGVILGMCPDDPNAVAFIAAPGTVYTFEGDVSVQLGNVSWSATVPSLPGILCDPFEVDSMTLISRNMEEKQIPKNALMTGADTHAGFMLQNIVSTLLSYDINGTPESDGTLTVEGSNLIPANTAKTLLADGRWNIDVEVRAGDSTDSHTYSTTTTGGESKEARIYPKATEDSQMYGIAWDESEVFWCARCVGEELLTLVIPGDLICKVADSCGCVGDGFDITVESVNLDKSSVVMHLQGYYGESDPAVRSAIGVTAFSDPTADHPSVTITLEKNRTGGMFEDGSIAQLVAEVTVRLESQHVNPEGVKDSSTVTIRVPVTDPWTWGSLEPTYATFCGCTPTL